MSEEEEEEEEVEEEGFVRKAGYPCPLTVGTPVSTASIIR